MLKTCPRCGITCDKYDADAIDEIFGFRMYKNAEYQQSQCKKCRSKAPLKLSAGNVVELKPCQQDNQPMVKFPIASEPTELERDLLKSLYVRTYPRDKEGVKRSYKFMWNKLHKRGLA